MEIFLNIDYSNIFNVSRNTARNDLNKLVDFNLVQKLKNKNYENSHIVVVNYFI